MSFFEALLTQPFLQRTLLAALMASVACGILGTYVVSRRNSYMVGAVSHCLLSGIGLARWCQVVLCWAWFQPILGALLSAVGAALLISFLSVQKQNRSDAVLSGIWTTGVAIGLCFIAFIPGYAEDLNSYLFGNILLVSNSDLCLMAALLLIILPTVRIYHTRFLAYCFQEEHLALRGISIKTTATLLNLLTALAIVLLAQIVGIVMVLALMILPAAAASRLCRRLPPIMLLASIICFLATVGGLYGSYATKIPTSAWIILLCTAAFLLATLCGKFFQQHHRA